MADRAAKRQSPGFPILCIRTASYDSVVNENPWAPTRSLNGEVPLRSTWTTLREDNDHASEQDDQAGSGHGP